MKRLIVLGITLVIVFLMVEFPHLMIKPGELSAGHQKLNNKCLACHSPFNGIANDKCITCHNPKDIGKSDLSLSDTSTNKTKILFHQMLSSQECNACHTDHKGVKPSNSLTNFKHDLLTVAVANNCSGCHMKPTDKLHLQLLPQCNSCHNTKGWKTGTIFNHDNIQGADKLNCVFCHNKPADAYHQQVAGNCNSCHSTTKWTPSTFEHSKYFQLDEHHNTKCITCHTTNNYSAYTCYGCHEHSESKIRSEHIEEGITNYNNCVSCHRSGNEHDIIKNGKSDNRLNQNGKTDGNQNTNSDNKKEGDEGDND